MELFDCHCHPQLSQFDEDRDTVLSRMQKKGMGSIVVGTDFETSKEAVALAETHDFLWASVGLHPNDNPSEEFEYGAYLKLAQHPKVVAIGECGLDTFRSEKNMETMQRERLEKHISLAREVRKPLIIHCRPSTGTTDMHEAMISILQKHSDVQAIIHFFTSTADIAKRYLALGCYISFPGPITYTDMYDEAIKIVPLEKLFVETDAPFAAPVPYRGRRNEPVYVEETARKVAAVKGISYKEVAAAVVVNAKTVFSLR